MYKCRQINESEDKERQNLPADYENDRYIPLLPFKVIKSSSKHGQGDKKLDLPGKYKIKEVLGEVLTWLLKVSSQRKYKGQKKSDSLQPPRNMMAT